MREEESGIEREEESGSEGKSGCEREDESESEEDS